jgi:hypothetical protein
LHQAVHVVDGGPVVIADVHHHDRSERAALRPDDLERGGWRRALERAARRDEAAADDRVRAQIEAPCRDSGGQRARSRRTPRSSRR